MNKQEYLERLQACLKHKLSKEEIEDIMRDYAEYFEEGRRQSKQDSEIAAKLGDPELVAEQLIEESQEQQVEYKVPGKGKEKKLGEYVGEYWKKAKQKFHDWDHGEAKHTAQQEEDTAEEAEQNEPENLEQEEMEKQTVPKKEPKPRREKLSGDGVLGKGVQMVRHPVCLLLADAAGARNQRPARFDGRRRVGRTSVRDCFLWPWLFAGPAGHHPFRIWFCHSWQLERHRNCLRLGGLPCPHRFAGDAAGPLPALLLGRVQAGCPLCTERLGTDARPSGRVAGHPRDKREAGKRARGAKARAGRGGDAAAFDAGNGRGTAATERPGGGMLE